MQAGVVAQTDASFEDISSFDRTVKKQGIERREVLEISQQITDLSGQRIGYEGRLAVQEPTTINSVSIGENASIARSEEKTKKWEYVEFLLVPNSYVIAGKGGDSDLLFQILENEITETIEQVSFNLHAYFKETESNIWKIGFYGREGNANNGVVHGDSVLLDEELGNIVENHATNQLGLEFEKNGREYKIFISESGYLEFYIPQDMDSSGFIQFLETELAEYTITSDE